VTLVSIPSPKKLRKGENKVCLNTRTMIRLIDVIIDCNAYKSVNKFPAQPNFCKSIIYCRNSLDGANFQVLPPSGDIKSDRRFPL
jgi:hypothetical protein